MLSQIGLSPEAMPLLLDDQPTNGNGRRLHIRVIVLASLQIPYSHAAGRQPLEGLGAPFLCLQNNSQI